jgi:hypothetical protein
MTAKDHAMNIYDEFYDMLSEVVPDMSLRGRRRQSEAAQRCALLFTEQMQNHCGHELTQYWRDVETQLQILRP